jgi:hypothetical protein
MDSVRKYLLGDYVNVFLSLLLYLNLRFLKLWGLLLRFYFRLTPSIKFDIILYMKTFIKVEDEYVVCALMANIVSSSHDVGTGI